MCALTHVHKSMCGMHKNTEDQVQGSCQLAPQEKATISNALGQVW
jgi:hypothetical protein